jgi:hypothetical protein
MASSLLVRYRRPAKSRRRILAQNSKASATKGGTGSEIAFSRKAQENPGLSVQDQTVRSKEDVQIVELMFNFRLFLVTSFQDPV